MEYTLLALFKALGIPGIDCAVESPELVLHHLEVFFAAHGDPPEFRRGLRFGRSVRSSQHPGTTFAVRPFIHVLAVIADVKPQLQRFSCEVDADCGPFKGIKTPRVCD